jgi:hypothetical protein
VGPRATARLVLDCSEHAGMLSRIDGAFLALDTEHGIYREQLSSLSLVACRQSLGVGRMCVRIDPV